MTDTRERLTDEQVSHYIEHATKAGKADDFFPVWGADLLSMLTELRELRAAAEWRDLGFVEAKDLPDPHTFLQWKGTDVCMDFHCECGAHCHFDGDFAYAVKCPHCGTVWQMPCHMFPRKADARTYPYHVENAKLLDVDEDHTNEEGEAVPVEPLPAPPPRENGG